MATPQNHANAYLATKVLTATPAELRLMLLDGAIRFGQSGRDGLANANFEAAFNGFTRCRAIIVELLTTMKADPNDPTLVGRLQALYGYMISRLLTASHEKNVAAADEVINLLKYERETWIMLMDQLTIEQRSAANNADDVAAAITGVRQPVGEFTARG